MSPIGLLLEIIAHVMLYNYEDEVPLKWIDRLTFQERNSSQTSTWEKFLRVGEPLKPILTTNEDAQTLGLCNLRA